MKRFVSVCLTIVVVMAFALTAMIYTSCSPEPQTPQNNNQGGGGGGGGGTPQVTVSGVISNYSSGWKPYVLKGTTYYYGSVSASGNPRPYSVSVPQNLGLATVGIFNDVNNNNQFDSGETNLSQIISVGTTNLTVNFTIPVFVTVSGTITNYVTGWKPYVIAGSQVFYGSVSASGNPRPYSVSVPQNLGLATVGIFNDTNNNDQFDIGETTISSFASILTANVTVNFTIVPIFTISGTLTGNPTPQWKVFANTGGGIITGTINASYNYTVSIASNQFVSSINAFKDDNNNGIYDPGEYLVIVNLGSLMVNNITTNINIPNLQNMTLKVFISNNVYNLRIGLDISSFPSYTKYSSSSKTNVNFEETFTIVGTTNDSISIQLYYDLNGDGDFDSVGGVWENILTLTNNLAFTNTTVTQVFYLVPHTVTGIVEQLGGASGFKPDLWYNFMPSGVGTTSGNTYKVQFYTYTNYLGAPAHPAVIRMFRDVNNNGIVDPMEEVVNHSNTMLTFANISTSDPSTNTGPSIYIKKVPLSVHLTGTDVSKFKYDYGVGSTFTNAFPFVKDIYFDTNDIYNYSFMVLVDENNDGLIGGGELSGGGFFTLSNQNSISVTQEVIRFVVTNTIITNANSLGSSPSFICQGYFIDNSTPNLFMSTNIVSTNMILTLYSTKSVVVGTTTNGVVDLMINSALTITNTNNSTFSISITNTGNTNLGIIWMD
ncbi:MAG: hypothetical protein N3D81_02220 [Spirochaetes bacterium]|nr:hypothetical protein [Spirochaetota bacterium]